MAGLSYYRNLLHYTKIRPLYIIPITAYTNIRLYEYPPHQNIVYDSFHEALEAGRAPK
jgi:hypothetical protein